MSILARSGGLIRRRRVTAPCLSRISLDVQFTDQAAVLHRNKNGLASLTVVRSGSAWHYAVPAVGSQVYSASVCTWKDGHAGAVSLGYDDGLLPSYADRLVLANYGFKATYFVVSGLSDADPTEGYFGYDEIEALYAAGHEIGCHTEHHWCDFDEKIPDPYATYADYATEEYGSWYTQYLGALTIPEEELRFSLAYPCGARDTDLDTAAAAYVKSVRGYWSGDYPGPLTGLNAPTPTSPDGVMLLRVLSEAAGMTDAIRIDFAKRTEGVGRWAIYVSHGTYNTTFLTALTNLDVWVAPQGRVVEYIAVRNALSITGLDVQSSGLTRTVSFTIEDGASLDTDYYNCPVSIKVAIAATDTVAGITVDGSPVSWAYKVCDGDRYVVFESTIVTSHSVVVTVVAAVAAGDDPATTNIIQAKGTNTACYDPSGGLWVRPAVENEVPYNVGANSYNAAHWTATDLTAGDGSADGVLIFSDKSAKLSSTGADATYTVTSDTLVADAPYMVGFVVVTIDEDLDAAHIGELIKPTVIQNAAECCFGRVHGRRLGTFFRNGSTYRAYDVWDAVLATQSDVATIGYTLPVSGSVVYVGALSMHRVTAGKQHFQWLGPIPQADDSQVSTDWETLQLLCSTPTALLPINADKPWALAIEVAYPLEAADDWGTYKSHLPSVFKTYLISWGQQDYGYLCTIMDYATRFRLRANASPGSGEDEQALSDDIVYSAMRSQWWGLTGQAGTPAQLWAARDTWSELFVGAPDLTQDAAQTSGCHQLTNGLLLLGACTGPAVGKAGSASPLGAVVRRVIFWERKKA